MWKKTTYRFAGFDPEVSTKQEIHTKGTNSGVSRDYPRGMGQVPLDRSFCQVFVGLRLIGFIYFNKQDVAHIGGS